MKHSLTIILTLCFILMVGGSLYLIYINTTQRWTSTGETRKLTICNQTILNLNQQIQVKEDLEKAIEFKELSEWLELDCDGYLEAKEKGAFFSIKGYKDLRRCQELDEIPFNEELYYSPPTEEVYQPPREPVCVEYEYYFNNKVCIKYD